MRLDTWFTSDIGLVRGTNQDSVGCFPAEGLFVVADGMGGRSSGEVASGLAVAAFQGLVSAASTDAAEAPPEAANRWSWRSVLGRRPVSANDDVGILRSAALAANQRIFEAGKAVDAQAAPSMGTTVVALRLDLERQRASWVHVGDSRLYRVRAGQLHLLTADHTVFGEAFQDHDLIPTDLRHSNRLVRALGIEATVEVSGGNAPIEVGDLFLLCSDGISGMLPPDTILSTLCQPTPLAQRGQSLLQQALDAGGRDNATLLLAQVLAP